MNVYLKTNGKWEYFKDITKEALDQRGIVIGTWASISNEARIGDRARIGDEAIIGNEARIGFDKYPEQVAAEFAKAAVESI